MLVFLFIATAIRAEPSELPDPSTGEIDGKAALRLVPNGVIEPGCIGHLVPVDAQEEDFVYPCGTWFLPPAPGRYIEWIEQGHRISQQAVLVYGAPAFHGMGLTLSKELVDAGEIRLAQPPPLEPGETVRFLSLVRHGAARLFDRRLPHDKADQSVRIRAGSVIAGIFDAEGNARAISTPTSVTAGARHEAALHVARDSDVLVVLSRHASPADGDWACDAELSLASGSKPPSFVLRHFGRFVAVWYDMPAVAGELTVSCGGSPALRRTVKLKKRSVLTIREEFKGGH